MLKVVLIHTCCADCFLNTLNFLKKEKYVDDGSEIISLFYNPNIHPRSEYIERLNAVKKVLSRNAKLIIPDYRPREYMEKIKKENRCECCWKLRLEYLFNYARENNIKNISSTLLASQYQDRDIISDIVDNLNKKKYFNFIIVDGHHNENHIGFYKQNYCGCCFSLTEKLLK